MTTLNLGVARWCKSSYSTSTSNCVEVAFPEPSWHKSSYSSDTSTCVEVSFSGPAVAIRDSKHPAGEVLAVSGDAWSALLSAARP